MKMKYRDFARKHDILFQYCVLKIATNPLGEVKKEFIDSLRFLGYTPKTSLFSDDPKTVRKRMDGPVPELPPEYKLAIAWDTRRISVIDVDNADLNHVFERQIITNHEFQTASFLSIGKRFIKLFYLFEDREMELGDNQNIKLIQNLNGFGRNALVEIQNGLWSWMEASELICNGDKIASINYLDFYNHLENKMGQDYIIQKPKSLMPSYSPPLSDTSSEAEPIDSNTSLSSSSSSSNHYKNSKEEIEALLDCIAPTTMSDYHDWLKIGMSLHQWSPSDGFLLWKSASSKALKGYDVSEWMENGHIFRTKWKSFDAHNGVTIGTLRYYARRDNPELYSSLTFKKNAVSYILNNCRHNPLARFVVQQFPDLQNRVFFDTNQEKWVICCPRTNKWMVQNKPTVITRDMIDFLMGHITCAEDEVTYIQKLVDSRDAHTNLDLVEFYKSNPSVCPDNIKNYIKERINLISKCKASIESATFMDNVMRSMTSEVVDNTIISKIDDQTHLFPFEDAVFNSRTKQFEPIRPHHYIGEMTTGYPILGFVSCPERKDRLLDFLQTIFVNENQLQNCLQLISSCIAGYNKFQKFGVWVGQGSNGKSTIMDIIKPVFGRLYITMPSSVLVNESRSRNETSCLMDARGTRLVFISEPEDKRKFMASEMKIISGERFIRKRQLFRQSEELKISFVPIIVSNDMFETNGFDDAIKRRIHPIHFKKRFVHENDNDDDGDQLSVLRTTESEELIDALKTDVEFHREFIMLLIDTYKDLPVTGLSNIPENEDLLRDIQETNDEPLLRVINDLFVFTNSESDKLHASDMKSLIARHIDENHNLSHIKVSAVMKKIREQRLEETVRILNKASRGFKRIRLKSIPTFEGGGGMTIPI